MATFAGSSRMNCPRGHPRSISSIYRPTRPNASKPSSVLMRHRQYSTTCRCCAAGSFRPAENIKPRDDAAWVLQGDRGITYASDVPTGSRLVEGHWWGKDYNGAPLVSFEKRLADGLGLKLGDPVTVNVLGRNITATIANMRLVDWESLGINFVMVFSPNAFAGAPHSNLATLTYPGGGTPAQEAATIRAVPSRSRWSPSCA